MTFHLKNQLQGTITKTHEEHLQLAQLDDQEIPKDKTGRPVCQVTFATRVNSNSDKIDIESSDKEPPSPKIVRK